MNITLSLPDPEDFFLAGLSYDHGIWRAYMKPFRRDGTGTLQGATGDTPQEAVDRALEAVKKMAGPVAVARAPRFNLDLSSMVRKL